MSYRLTACDWTLTGEDKTAAGQGTAGEGEGEGRIAGHAGGGRAQTKEQACAEVDIWVKAARDGLFQ